MKFLLPVASILLTAVLGSPALAQSMNDITISVNGGGLQTIEPLEVFDLEVRLENLGTSGVIGWSFAVEHDPSALDIQSVSGGDLSGTVPAPIVAPPFEQISIIDNASGNGFLNATILSVSQDTFFPPATTQILSTATYQNLLVVDGDETEVEVVEDVLANIPSPPVQVNVSVIGGGSFEFGEVDLVPLTLQNTVPPSFEYAATDETLDAVLGVDTPEAVVDLSIEQVAPFFENSDQDFSGFSMSVQHDPIELELVQVDPVTGVTDPTSVAFFGFTIFEGGFVLGVFAEIDAAQPFSALNASSKTVVARATYSPDVSTALLVGGEVFSSAIEFSDGLSAVPGGIPVMNELVIDDGSGGELLGSVQTLDGSVEIRVVTTNDFIRGDCNDDGLLNIADAIVVLQNVVAALGSGTSGEPDCVEACNADGATPAGGNQPISINDAILILAFTLGLDPANLSNPAPGMASLPAPGTACGQVMGQSPEDCVVFDSCP